MCLKLDPMVREKEEKDILSIVYCLANFEEGEDSDEWSYIGGDICSSFLV